MVYSRCGESLDIAISFKSCFRTPSVVVAIMLARWSNYAENIQRQCWTSVEVMARPRLWLATRVWRGGLSSDRQNALIAAHSGSEGSVGRPPGGTLYSSARSVSWALVPPLRSFSTVPAARAVLALVAPTAAAAAVAAQHLQFYPSSLSAFPPMSSLQPPRQLCF